jgi:hypothetical protein
MSISTENIVENEVEKDPINEKYIARFRIALIILILLGVIISANFEWGFFITFFNDNFFKAFFLILFLETLKVTSIVFSRVFKSSKIGFLPKFLFGILRFILIFISVFCVFLEISNYSFNNNFYLLKKAREAEINREFEKRYVDVDTTCKKEILKAQLSRDSTFKKSSKNYKVKDTLVLREEKKLETKKQALDSIKIYRLGMVDSILYNQRAHYLRAIVNTYDLIKPLAICNDIKLFNMIVSISISLAITIALECGIWILSILFGILLQAKFLSKLGTYFTINENIDNVKKKEYE